jgi:phosphate-selective porin O/P
MLVLVLSLSTRLSAQGAQSAPLTFDLLQAARAADSLRVIINRQRTELARLQREMRDQSDSLRVQQRRIAELEQSSTRRLRQEAPSGDSALSRVLVDTIVRASEAPLPPPPPPPPPSTRLVAAVPSPSAPPALSIGGLFQLWAVAGNDGYRNSFRLRRAEIKGTQELGAHTKAVVMVDVAKTLALSSSATPTTGQAVTQSSRALQDAYVTSTLGIIRVDAGQQKLPLGLEGQQSSGSLESVERAMFASDRTRGGTYGDIRDLGIQLRSSLHTLLDLQLGVFNGSGESQNDVDKNVAKAVAGRAVVHVPFANTLQVGASGVSAGASTADKPRRDRGAVELTFERGGVMLRSEAVSGWDGVTRRHGLYALGRYALNRGLSVHARFDAWDPDVSDESTAATAVERDYLAGASWQPPGTKARVQFAAVRKTFSSQRSPSLTQFVTNIQAAW